MRSLSKREIYAGCAVVVCLAYLGEYRTWILGFEQNLTGFFRMFLGGRDSVGIQRRSTAVPGYHDTGTRVCVLLLFFVTPKQIEQKLPYRI